MSVSYTPTARALHWIMGLLLILMLAAGLVMEDIEDPALKGTVYTLHKATGILILALAAFRVLWRFSHAVPAFAASLRPWQATAARWVHFGLYAIMFIMPISGWGMSSAAGYPVSFYGLFVLPNLVSANPECKELFETIHSVGANAFMILLAAHVAAALYHHLILKDNTLRRIWRG